MREERKNSMTCVDLRKRNKQICELSHTLMHIAALKQFMLSTYETDSIMPACWRLGLFLPKSTLSCEKVYHEIDIKIASVNMSGTRPLSNLLKDKMSLRLKDNQQTKRFEKMDTHFCLR